MWFRLSLCLCGSSAALPDPVISQARHSFVEREIAAASNSSNRYPPSIIPTSTTYHRPHRPHLGKSLYQDPSSSSPFELIPLAPPTPFQHPIRRRRKSSAAAATTKDYPSILKQAPVPVVEVVEMSLEHQLNEVGRPMYDTLDGGKGALEQYAGHRWYIPFSRCTYHSTFVNVSSQATKPTSATRGKSLSPYHVWENFSGEAIDITSISSFSLSSPPPHLPDSSTPLSTDAFHGLRGSDPAQRHLDRCTQDGA